MGGPVTCCPECGSQNVTLLQLNHYYSVYPLRPDGSVDWDREEWAGEADDDDGMLFLSCAACHTETRVYWDCVAERLTLEP